MNLLEYVTNELELLLIIFSRMTGFFVISPVFSRRNFPTIAKIALSLLLALLIGPILGDVIEISSNLIPYYFLIIKEFFVGFVIGFCSFITFSSIYIAGQIIDRKIGFGLVNILDPQINVQVPMTGNFKY
ncbi:MAG TPA: flagellar biosynthetic protein FliR, partial [Thermoanaerobacterales bacterium]|nr:flagellar biosynthetic protein FliR [Thermoanaerobacterales bacterium]